MPNLSDETSDSGEIVVLAALFKVEFMDQTLAESFQCTIKGWDKLLSLQQIQNVKVSSLWKVEYLF